MTLQCKNLSDTYSPSVVCFHRARSIERAGDASGSRISPRFQLHTGSPLPIAKLRPHTAETIKSNQILQDDRAAWTSSNRPATGFPFAFHTGRIERQPLTSRQLTQSAAIKRRVRFRTRQKEPNPKKTHTRKKHTHSAAARRAVDRAHVICATYVVRNRSSFEGPS